MCFKRLPPEIQEQARQTYRIWQDNHFHPSLHFKKIHGLDDVFSVRIGIGWRAIGVVQGNTITWAWIGSHADYDRLIDQ